MTVRPNVLLVTVDSLRADHVGCVADAPVETPAVDRLAEAGAVYETAYAQGPFTTFSMPSLFTGRYPSRLEYVRFSEGVVGVAPGEAPTVAELLSGAGYETAGFHSNPLLSALFGFDRGFDVFDADVPLSGLDLPGRLALLATKLRRLVRRHAYLPAGPLTDRAVDWVGDRSDGSPFLLWTHYMDPHGPYQPRSGPTYVRKYRSERLWQKVNRSPEQVTAAEHDRLTSAYREEVAHTDEHVGRLVEAVDRATDRPTLVVFTADHGDAFGEHGYYGHPHEVDDVLLRVPLVVRDPTGTVTADRVSRPTELLDVLPTVLAATGVESPGTLEGRSLAAGVEDPVAIGEGELDPDHRTAFVTADWRYVVDRVDDREVLVDRADGRAVDPADHPETHDALSALAEQHHGRASATGGEDREEAIEDSDARSRLRDLGYLE